MKQDGLHGALAELQRLDEVRELPQDDARRIDEQPRLVSRFYDVVTTSYEPPLMSSLGARRSISPRDGPGKAWPLPSGGTKRASASAFGCGQE